MDPTHAYGAPGIERQLLDVFLYLGSSWVLYVLLGLSVISVAVVIERALYFLRNRDDLEALQTGLNDRLNQGEVDQARSLLAGSRSNVSVIALKGLDALGRGVGAVEEVVAGATALERLKMERGLAFLGSLGNNAPFVGLFGTVLGIIRAFRDLAMSQSQGSEAVMAGIAEALVATAVGLLVALPAVALFNYFQRRIRSQLASADALSRILLAYAKSQRS